MTLPRHGLARTTDPDTSKDAAQRIDPASQHAAILRTLAYLVEGNAYEISRASGLTEHQLSRRLSELAEAHRITWTGRTRPGPTGRQQRVWTLPVIPENEQRQLWGDR